MPRKTLETLLTAAHQSDKVITHACELLTGAAEALEDWVCTLQCIVCIVWCSDMSLMCINIWCSEASLVRCSDMSLMYISLWCGDISLMYISPWCQRCGHRGACVGGSCVRASERYIAVDRSSGRSLP